MPRGGSQLEPHPLERRLGECMLADRHRLRRRLRALANAKDAARALLEVEAALEHSAKQRAARQAKQPTVRYELDLPVVSAKDEIAEAIGANPTIVLCGETGSGKTTQLPKICLGLGRGVAAMIGHTQPRRIAARSVAARIAEELGTTVGGQRGQWVGSQIRFADSTGPDTRVKVMTDGILLAETRRDRFLDRYDTIIIDEAHERSLNIDFLLGYLKRLQRKRRNLKVIVTSATIDPQRFSDHFDGAPILEVSGRTYPVEMRYRPNDDADVETPRAIVEAVRELCTAGPGDVLVFLPGEREIRETAKALRAHHHDHTEVLPLYARLATGDQQRVFKPHQGRRIVLATNVAETSLTVPGIRYVVDPGLARISRYSSKRRVQLLPIEPIAQASADQRAGRCGRVESGVCIRLFAEDDYAKRDRFTDPEILRTNLASVILQMHALDLGDVERFPFVEPPRRAAVREGIETLHEIGALDDEEALTPIGRTLSDLPVDPRIGRMILAGNEEGCLTEVLIVATALAAQDPRDRPMDKADAADAAHERFADGDSDFQVLINVWDFYHEQKAKLTSGKLRKACQQNFINFVRMREWTDLHRQMREIARDAGLKFASPERTPEERYTALHRALLSGLLSNVAMLDEGHAYEGTGGKTLHIFPGSGLFHRKPKWIVAAELIETTKLYARTVARIDPAWLESLAPHLVKRSYDEPRFDPERGQVIANERVSLYGLPIVPRRRAHYGPVAPVLARELFIHEGLAEMTWEVDAPFAHHNRKMIEEIDQLQAKARRRDLLAEANARFEFYDQRVPKDVYSGTRFEKWRRKIEQRKPKLLYMTQNDLLVGEAGIAIEQFPDTVIMDGVEMPLCYRLEPGHPDDGVTLEVPLAAMGRIDEERLPWLVPGRLREVTEALLKTLPKSIRRELGPAPQLTAACMPHIEFGRGDIRDQLGSAVARVGGVLVERGDWNFAGVPDHLRMNIAIIGDDEQRIDADRDLAALRRRIAPAARDAISRHGPAEWKQDGLTAWTCDELPGEVKLPGGLRGCPALVDKGRSCDLRLIDDPTRAVVTHRRGVVRLAILAIESELDSAIRYQPSLETLLLRYAGLGHGQDLLDQLKLQTVHRLCAPLNAPRNATDFKSLLDTIQPDVWDAASAVVATTNDVLAHHAALLEALDRPIPKPWAPSIDDVHDHLDALLRPGFIADAHPGWYPHVPRYVEAALTRVRKLAGGGHARDQKAMGEIAELAADQRRRERDANEQGIVDHVLEYRMWLLEELRVATFAQELGTAEKVSVARIRGM
ncbi:MAG: ATP-dependent RNA helicase HrpA [Planctomycetota bacterium]